jgi:hypothetical protein
MCAGTPNFFRWSLVKERVLLFFEGYEASASYPSSSSNMKMKVKMELGGETSRKEIS